MSWKTSRMWKIALFSGAFFAMIALSLGVQAITFDNPINSKTLEDLVKAISAGVLKVAFVLAPVFIIISGFRFLVAASTGNQAGLATAKKLFFWTLIGTAIVGGAYAISTIIIEFAKGL